MKVHASAGDMACRQNVSGHKITLSRFESNKLNNKIDLAVYVTALALAVSVFLPLTHIPIVGDVSYHRVAEVEAYIVVFFCVSSIGLLVAGMPKLTVLAPIGVWITLFFPAIRNAMDTDDGGLFADVTDRATGIMQEFAADLFLNVAEFGWGGYVYLIALITFTAACSLRLIKS